ncbi:hydroxyacid dehydrogenase [Candidatus Bathyarchaeota archaeon]|nr:hydroxyacid dehydrogenase [Candidatus Bathyarchaeota archaeon]
MRALKFTVLVTEPIHPDGVRLMEEKGLNVISLQPGSEEEDLLREVIEADALVTRGGLRVTREAMTASRRLRAIGVHGVGVDHIDLQAARELDIVIFNTPTALTETVAEMTIALMLSLMRRIVPADKAVRCGQWNRKYTDLIGTELMGKTVGIIGLGRIGSAVARRLSSFGVRMLYYDLQDRGDLESELGIRKVGLEDLLKGSDIISIHLPLTSETRGLISKSEFDLMKEGAYIVNTARGGILVEKDLIEALRSGRISGAALDVFEAEPLGLESPLTQMDNVILTPHLAASSTEAMRRMALEVAEGIIKVSRGEKPPNIVT